MSELDFGDRPAFPQTGEGGLTVLEYYVGQAMTGLLATGAFNRENILWSPPSARLAEVAWEIAQAIVDGRPTAVES